MWSDDTRVVVYIKILNNGRRGHREKEREYMCTLTARHTCHRPRIPFRHVLIERRCLVKHCKRGCNKEQDKINPPQTTTKGTVSNTQKIKITKRVRSVIRWNSSCRIQRHISGRVHLLRAWPLFSLRLHIRNKNIVFWSLNREIPVSLVFLFRPTCPEHGTALKMRQGGCQLHRTKGTGHQERTSITGVLAYNIERIDLWPKKHVPYHPQWRLMYGR